MTTPPEGRLFCWPWLPVADKFCSTTLFWQNNLHGWFRKPTWGNRVIGVSGTFEMSELTYLKVARFNSLMSLMWVWSTFLLKYQKELVGECWFSQVYWWRMGNALPSCCFLVDIDLRCKGFHGCMSLSPSGTPRRGSWEINRQEILVTTLPEGDLLCDGLVIGYWKLLFYYPIRQISLHGWFRKLTRGDKVIGVKVGKLALLNNEDTILFFWCFLCCKCIWRPSEFFLNVWHCENFLAAAVLLTADFMNWWVHMDYWFVICESSRGRCGNFISISQCECEDETLVILRCFL